MTNPQGSGYAPLTHSSFSIQGSHRSPAGSSGIAGGQAGQAGLASTGRGFSRPLGWGRGLLVLGLMVGCLGQSCGNAPVFPAGADDQVLSYGPEKSLPSTDEGVTSSDQEPATTDATDAESNVVLLDENFNLYEPAANPVAWFDTAAFNSMDEADELFGVMDVDGASVFGTSSLGTNIHSHYVGSGASDWTNYEYTGRLRMSARNGGTGVTFLSDYPNSDAYYRLRRYGNYTFHIDPHGTEITRGSLDTGVKPLPNAWYRFRIQVEDTGAETLVRAKIWEEAESEPQDWQVECADASPTRRTHGTVGVWSYLRGSKYWDDLKVTELASEEIPNNAAPTVSAGADQAILWPENQVQLGGVVMDDGLPATPGATNWQWLDVSGPGQVAFTDAGALDSVVTFDQPGSYELVLEASDGELEASDTVVIHVIPEMTVYLGPSGGAAPLTVQFAAFTAGELATGLPEGSTLRWDFGDGTEMKQGLQTTHTYSSAGTYVVTCMLALGGTLGTINCAQEQVDVAAWQAPSELTVPYSPRAATVDGTITPGEYLYAAPYTMDGSDYTSPGIVVGGALADTGDTSAIVYLQHDEEYIYVAVDVHDDQVIGTADFVWNTDCVELFLDHDNSDSVNVGLNRYQFDVSANGDSLATQIVPALSWTGRATRRSNGYVVEYALSKSALGLQDGQTYGFDIAISDVEPTGGQIETRYWFFADSDASMNEAAWGDLRLMPSSDIETPPALAVSTSLLSLGTSDTTATFEMSNAGDGSFAATVTPMQDWISVSPAASDVSGSPVPVTVTLDRVHMEAGANVGKIRVDAGDAGFAEITVDATVIPGELTLTSGADLASAGDVGGPFDPSATTYTIENTGGRMIAWSARSSEAWLAFSPSSGRLDVGQQLSIEAALTTTADGLAAGDYEATLAFTNVTDTLGTTTRTASLTVTDPPVEPEDPVALLDEDFEGYANGADPGNWLDTAAYNSMAEDDTLFETMAVGNTMVLGTYSTLANIHSHYIGAGSSTWNDYEFTGRLLKTDTLGAIGVTFLSDYPNSDRYYRLRCYEGGSMHIDPHGTSMTSGQVDTGVVMTPNVWYQFRVQVEDTGSATAVRAKIWPASNQEPTAWQVDCTDSSSTRRVGGTVGLWSYYHGAKYWDDLTVVGTDDLPEVNVAIDTSAMSGTAPLEITFDAVAAAAGESLPEGTFQWDFGDGSASQEGTTVTHVFNNSGQYTVSLAVLLAGGITVPCDTQAVTVSATPVGILDVSPDTSFTSVGPAGGPFSVESVDYAVTNSGDADLAWEVTANQPWLVLSVDAGRLAPGVSQAVNVALADGVDALPVGTYHDTLTFRTTDGSQQTTRTVRLEVESVDGGGDADSMETANRTSGVAPLAVMFDAVDVGSGVIQPSDGDHANLLYEWDFGDPASGTWATTGNARNYATGYIAGHLYETPGTYTARLTVTTPQGASYDYEQTITVTSFSGTTYYVSSSGSDNNDGRSTSTPFRTVPKAASVMGHNTRVLFKRGDSWSTNAQILLTSDGPGIIGAYGSGAKPVINCNADTLFLGLRGDDWRVMDVALVGCGGNSVGIEGMSDSHCLVLRCDVSRFRVGVASSWISPLAHNGNMYIDSEIHHNSSNNGYLAGYHLGILGCNLHNSSGTHVVRIWHMRRGLISNSILHDPGGDRHALKLHNELALNLPDSQHITISDNDFRGNTWVVAIGPQNSGYDERIRDLLFERNFVRSNSMTQALVCFWARGVTARNNVLIGTGSSQYNLGFLVARRGAEPNPERIRIYNNTLYKADNGSEMVFARVYSGTDIVIRNNLMCLPSFTGYQKDMLQNSVTVTADHNLYTAANQFVNPGSDDFRLRSGAAALDAGTNLSTVWDDVFGAARPQGAAFDLGATEQ